MTSPTKDILPRYAPSNRVGGRGAFYLASGGLFSAMLVGGLYLWARGETGSFVTIALCDLLFVMVFAIAAHTLFRIVRSRAPRFNRIAAAAWVALALLPWWLVAVHGRFAGIEAPTALQHYAVLVPTLLFLALEACILGLLPVLLSGQIASEPFSEKAGQWAEKDFSLETLWPDIGADALLEHLRNDGPSALATLEPAAGRTAGTLASSWSTLKIEGRSVESDPDARWLSLYRVESQRTDSGSIKSTDIPLAESWPVSADDYNLLRTRAVAPDDTDATNNVAARTPATAPANPTDAPTPVELEPAVAALDAGNHAAALTMALPHCQHPDAPVRNDAHRLAALCLSRLERWPEAFEHYYALFEHEPRAFNALQLATSSVMAGELLRGQAWFQKADELNQADRTMAPAELRTGFLSALRQAGEYEACLPHLEWMAGLYASLRTTDSHLLWMNRIPPFQEYLDRSADILRELMPPAQCAEWYARHAGDLAPEWRALLDRHVEGLA